MNKKRYFVYPYMISLLIFGAILFTAAGLIAYLSTQCWPFLILYPSIFLFMLLIEWLEGYKMLGWVTLDEEAISLHAPLRRTLTLRWQDVRHAGFGGSSTEVLSFDWIYLRTEPLPPRYQHRMHRLPCTPDSIRFQYREDLFQAMLPRLNKPVRTMLEAGRRRMEEQARRP
ncbi:MAG: hypothetical protein IJE07_11240 [Clostridia bacterium]|nr:hypothetical protein [Clostridia bacterium]